MPSQNKIRERVTTTIIEALEQGGLPPWKRPWRNDVNAGFPTNVVSGKKYRGINPLLLRIASIRHNFQSKHWATFKQWDELGGRVMRRPDDVPAGQWGQMIVFWKPVSKTVSDEKEKDTKETYFVLKTFTVFNIDQVRNDAKNLDHLRVGYGEGEAQGMIDNYLDAKRVVEATGADIRHGGNEAYYRPSYDFIQLPHQSQMGLNEYYETAFHELCHWSEPRLNWKGSYAEGELIAEIGSCFLAEEVGIPTTDDLRNHATYLQSWLTAMREDSKFIFRASSQAAKAADFILSFSRTPSAEPEPAFAD